MASLQEIDIEAEIAAHKAHSAWDQQRKDINDLSGAISRAKLDQSREDKAIVKLEAEIASLANHTCHTCGQEFHDEKHEQVLAGKQKDLAKKPSLRSLKIICLPRMPNTLVQNF